jgi:sRNA-binding carbon storage regulator CsrA
MKEQEKILIGNDIQVFVKKRSGNKQYRMYISAPRDLKVARMPLEALSESIESEKES